MGGSGRIRLASIAALGALLAIAAPARGAPVADYQLNGDLSSSIAGAQPLADVGAGSSVFQTDTVNGCTRRVLAFPAGHGFNVNVPPATLEADWAVTVTFRLDSTGAPGFYERILGFDAAPPSPAFPSSDDGLYFKEGLLDIYLGGDQSLLNPAQSTASGQWVTITFVRDYETGVGTTMFSYRNGTPVGQRGDGPGAFFTLAGNTVTLFKDNDTEESGGAVARILAWNTFNPMDQTELYSPPAAPCVPPPPPPAAAKKKCKRKKAKKRSAEAAKKKKKCRKKKKRR